MLEIVRSRNLECSGHGFLPAPKQQSWMRVSPDGHEQPELGTHVLNEGEGMTCRLGGWMEVGPQEARLGVYTRERRVFPLRTILGVHTHYLI